jgi:predicted DNA-binding antitoxin AbrB/MazE fold protein
MSFDAIYVNGVFRPLHPVNIPDNAKVRIENVQVLDGTAGNDERPLMRLLEIAYRYPDNPNAPTDGAAQHDHYLYGTPKRP